MAENTKNVRVKPEAGEVQVLKSLGSLKDVNGNFLAYDHVNVTYQPGQVIPADDVSPVVIEKLESGDEYTNSLLEFAGDGDESPGPQEPFEGYSELSTEEVVRALATLPGVTVEKVREYEAANQNRADVVNYNYGFRESPAERYTGQVQPAPSDPVEKPAVERVATRVTEGTEVVTGENVATGEPAVALHEAQNEDSVDAPEEQAKPKPQARKATKQQKADSNESNDDK